MTKAAPWGLTWRSKTPFIMTTVALGLFTDLFLYGLPVPLLPYILEDRLRLPATEIQNHSSSLLAAHAVSAAVFCPIAGILTDKFSARKVPYLTGVLALLLSAVLFFLGGNMTTLVIARVLQGISGGLVWTVSQAILIDTVGAENVGKATGSIYGTISIGVLAAPVLGGILYHRTGVAGPLALGCSLLGVDLIMRLLMVEKKVAVEFGFSDGDPAERGQHSEDAHNEGAENPLLKTPQNQAYVIPPEQPLVIRSYPILYCFKDVRMLTANWITLVQATLLGTLDATVPTVGEEYYDLNSLQAGLLFIPILLPVLAIGPVAGWMTDRQGPKTIVVWGFGLLVPIFILLRIVQPGGLTQILIYCIILTLCGTCLAATNPPALVESTLVTEKYHKANPEMFGPNGPYAQISSITGFMYNAGTALGPLLAGALKNAVGYGNMNLVTAALSLITALLGFFYTGGKPVDMDRK
ncbi:MAG: hypothetical protein M1836_002245 [Candelina mexicana]|nr:MAG: hypothetical protein M1836_002245 [Candelina mexicana]